MLPIERQQKIVEIVQNQKHAKISELSKYFSVSEMTIHRDLKPLIEKGIIIKTFGGVTYAPQKSEDTQHGCVYCHRPIHHKLAYRLVLKNHLIETACCAHCGLLRYHQLNENVSQAICFDFLRLTTINALTAYYVFHTSIDMGCCHPQILTFELKEHAIKFVNSFEGQVVSFSEAINIIVKRMEERHSSTQ